MIREINAMAHEITDNLFALTEFVIANFEYSRFSNSASDATQRNSV